MRFIALLICAWPAAAQPFSFGIKAGVPLTDLADTVRTPQFSFQSNNKRYIVGATAELRLPFGLGVEVDALYRRFNAEGSGTILDVITNNRTTGNAWEFPLLAKYRFPAKPFVRPFVDAGVAWDTLSGLTTSVTRSISTGSPVVVAPGTAGGIRTTTGFVMGAGVEIKAILIRLTPELRYTRWGAQDIGDFNGLLRNRNQAEFLLGITF